MQTKKTIITTSRSSKRAGWAPIWLLAFLFALPSCFEISCIKLVGCELLSDDAGDPLTGNQIGETDFDPSQTPGAARALEHVVDCWPNCWTPGA
jgi:hypothetical protein